MSKKPSLSDKLQQEDFSNKRRIWIDKLNEQDRAELEEVRRNFNAGKYAGNTRQISKWLIANCKLQICPDTISRWLRNH